MSITEATVILDPGTRSEYKAISGQVKVRDYPAWMGTHEKLVDISFESSEFTKHLDELHIERGEKIPHVDVNLQTTQGSLFIFNGKIMDSWPNKITVSGYLQKDPDKASVLDEEVKLLKVMTIENKMEIEKEVKLKSKLIDEPDLNRFRTIDWED